MLLRVENLSVYYQKFPYLEDINFSIERGEIFSIVGESGSGKTLTGLSLINLLPPYFKSKGKIFFDNTNLLDLPEFKLRNIRGRRISMVFQDPSTSLNPVMKVYNQIAEMLIYHFNLSKKEALMKTMEILERLKISHVANSYPHQLSGGMKQRIMIGMAIACSPELIIADEPTTALDVTVQEEILDLLYYLTKNDKKSLLLISHDINIVSEYADRIMVMYAGRILEEGGMEEVYKNPLHPYTKALFKCIPSEGEKIEGIPGSIPNLKALPEGCIFHPRCEFKKPLCKKKIPSYVMVSQNHYVRCLLF